MTERRRTQHEPLTDLGQGTAQKSVVSGAGRRVDRSRGMVVRRAVISRSSRAASVLACLPKVTVAFSTVAQGGALAGAFLFLVDSWAAGRCAGYDDRSRVCRWPKLLKKAVRKAWRRKQEDRGRVCLSLVIVEGHGRQRCCGAACPVVRGRVLVTGME